MCIYVYIYIYMHMYLYIYTILFYIILYYIKLYPSIYVYICIYTHTHVSIYIYVCLMSSAIHLHILPHLQIPPCAKVQDAGLEVGGACGAQGRRRARIAGAGPGFALEWGLWGKKSMEDRISRVHTRSTIDSALSCFMKRPSQTKRPWKSHEIRLGPSLL